MLMREERERDVSSGEVYSHELHVKPRLRCQSPWARVITDS